MRAHRHRRSPTPKTSNRSSGRGEPVDWSCRVRGQGGKAHEVHATALTRAGVESVGPEGSGTLVTRVARGYTKAGVKFSREPVAKVIRKELQELRRMPYLSDLGRETAERRSGCSPS
jgi:hypothetical protein